MCIRDRHTLAGVLDTMTGLAWLPADPPFATDRIEWP